MTGCDAKSDIKPVKRRILVLQSPTANPWKPRKKGGGLRLWWWQKGQRTQTPCKGSIHSDWYSLWLWQRQIFRSGWVELSRWWKLRNLPKLWTSWRVDAGYQGENFARVIEQLCGAKVEVIKRSETAFQVLPKRWIVERTFGWLNHYRRLIKDYELLPEVSETMIYAAMTRLMLKRLTKH